jgi:flagellar hook assembly protein FlgD
VAGAALLIALMSCQTAKPALVAPAESQVEVEKSGFCPSGPAGQNSIEISLLFGNSDSVSSWKLGVSSGSSPSKTWTGDASYLPASLTWDGKTDAGTLAPEGTYKATLTVDYKEKYQSGSAESRSFLLDITPPTGSISANPPTFTPTENGVQGPVTLTITAQSAVAKMDSWSMDVLDQAGGLVKSWSGQWPKAAATWDGTSIDGGYVRPSTTYKVVATVRDEFGNSAQIKADLAVAALEKTTPAVTAQLPPAAPTPPPKPGQPSIAATTLGFSPNAQQVANTLTLAVGWGQPSSVVSWKAAVAQKGGAVQKTWTGGSGNLPASLVWDGKSDSGSMAPEGTYTASLSVDYGSAFAASTATSPDFILDVTPPRGTITLSSPLFSPIESSDTITLKLAASSATAKIDSWAMDIYDPGGSVFRSFSSKWPQNSIVWDGHGTGGDLVQSAEDYPVVATVRDVFGNIGTVKSVVPVDILVEKMASGYRILASRIFFKAFTADYRDVAPDLAAQNMSRLDALAAKLKKFPGYQIRLVGHAVSIYWDDPVKGALEQKDVLLPLSKSRAEAVKEALVERGLEASRFTTDGVGASDQLVPDSDYKDRWQNRRVALFMEK